MQVYLFEFPINPPLVPANRPPAQSYHLKEHYKRKNTTNHTITELHSQLKHVLLIQQSITNYLSAISVGAREPVYAEIENVFHLRQSDLSGKIPRYTRDGDYGEKIR